MLSVCLSPLSDVINQTFFFSAFMNVPIECVWISLSLRAGGRQTGPSVAVGVWAP